MPLAKTHQFGGTRDNICLHFGAIGWIHIPGCQHVVKFPDRLFDHAILVADPPLLNKQRTDCDLGRWSSPRISPSIAATSAPSAAGFEMCSASLHGTFDGVVPAVDHEGDAPLFEALSKAASYSRLPSA